MASLKDARALADDLRKRVEVIVAEFDGDVDFRRIVTLADDLGQASDRFAGTFNAIDAAFASHGSRPEAAAEEPEIAEEELAAALAPSRSRGRRSQKAESPSEAGSDGAGASEEQEEQEAEATATRSRA